MSNNNNADNIRLQINQKLVESGEKENIKEFLRSKLVECGWRDALKAHCKTIVKQQNSDNITVEELTNQIFPFAKSSVPENVKADVLKKVQAFVEANVD